MDGRTHSFVPIWLRRHFLRILAKQSVNSGMPPQGPLALHSSSSSSSSGPSQLGLPTLRPNRAASTSSQSFLFSPSPPMRDLLDSPLPTDVGSRPMSPTPSYGTLSISIPADATVTEPLHRLLPAAILMLDMSGFTSMSEKLGKETQGVETMSRYLNRFFGAIVERIEECGGDVVKFAGDAILVMFSARDEDDDLKLRTDRDEDETHQSLEDQLSPNRKTSQSLEESFHPLHSPNSSSSASAFSSSSASNSSLPWRGARRILFSRLICRAALCALRIHQQFDPFSVRADVTLRLHSAISVGDCAALCLGGTGAASGVTAKESVASSGRYEFLLNGPPLMDIGPSLKAAKIGEIVLSPLAARTLEESEFKSNFKLESINATVQQSYPSANLSECRLLLGLNSTTSGTTLDSLCTALHCIPITSAELLRANSPVTRDDSILQAELERLLAPFLPTYCVARLADGQGLLLAELRRLSTVFIQLPDFDTSASVTDGGQRTANLYQFNSLVEIIIGAAAAHHGEIRQILCDDKGTVAILLFGLVSHSNTALRAVKCAVDIHHRFDDLSCRAAIGVTSGNVFAGMIGSSQRCEYAAVGDKVNTAARLMSRAGDGILVDEETKKATSKFIHFVEGTPLQLKGKAEPTRVFRPTTDTVDEKERDENLGPSPGDKNLLKSKPLYPWESPNPSSASASASASAASPGAKVPDPSNMQPIQLQRAITYTFSLPAFSRSVNNSAINLVGRHHELQFLEQQLLAASTCPMPVAAKEGESPQLHAHDTQPVIFVHGKAGEGKSTLLARSLQYAKDVGLLVLVGNATEVSSTSSFSAFSHLIPDLLRSLCKAEVLSSLAGSERMTSQSGSGVNAASPGVDEVQLKNSFRLDDFAFTKDNERRLSSRLKYLVQIDHSIQIVENVGSVDDEAAPLFDRTASDEFTLEDSDSTESADLEQAGIVIRKESRQSQVLAPSQPRARRPSAALPPNIQGRQELPSPVLMFEEKQHQFTEREEKDKEKRSAGTPPRAAHSSSATLAVNQQTPRRNSLPTSSSSSALAVKDSKGLRNASHGPNPLHGSSKTFDFDPEAHIADSLSRERHRQRQQLQRTHGNKMPRGSFDQDGSSVSGLSDAPASESTAPTEVLTDERADDYPSDSGKPTPHTELAASLEADRNREHDHEREAEAMRERSSMDAPDTAASEAMAAGGVEEPSPIASNDELESLLIELLSFTHRRIRSEYLAANMVLVMEDVHWIDAASLRLLDAIINLLPSIMVIVSGRTIPHELLHTTGINPKQMEAGLLFRGRKDKDKDKRPSKIAVESKESKEEKEKPEVVDPQSDVDATPIFTRAASNPTKTVYARSPTSPDDAAPTVAPRVYGGLMRGVAVVHLSALAPEQVKRLVCLRVGADDCADELMQFVMARGGGSPLFTEQLLMMLLHNNHLNISDSVVSLSAERLTSLSLPSAANHQHFAVPESLSELIATRIDSLNPSQQFVLKVAAVFGFDVSVEALVQILLQSEVITAEDGRRKTVSELNQEFTVANSPCRLMVLKATRRLRKRVLDLDALCAMEFLKKTNKTAAIPQQNTAIPQPIIAVSTPVHSATTLQHPPLFTRIPSTNNMLLNAQSPSQTQSQSQMSTATMSAMLGASPTHPLPLVPTQSILIPPTSTLSSGSSSMRFLAAGLYQSTKNIPTKHIADISSFLNLPAVREVWLSIFASIQGILSSYYAFNHAIIRDVAYARLPFSYRANFHHLIAEWHEMKYSSAATSASSSTPNLRHQQQHLQTQTQMPPLQSLQGNSQLQTSFQTSTRLITRTISSFALGAAAVSTAPSTAPSVHLLTANDRFRTLTPILDILAYHYQTAAECEAEDQIRKQYCVRKALCFLFLLMEAAKKKEAYKEMVNLSERAQKMTELLIDIQELAKLIVEKNAIMAAASAKLPTNADLMRETSEKDKDISDLFAGVNSDERALIELEVQSAMCVSAAATLGSVRSIPLFAKYKQMAEKYVESGVISCQRHVLGATLGGVFASLNGPGFKGKMATEQKTLEMLTGKCWQLHDERALLETNVGSMLLMHRKGLYSIALKKALATIIICKTRILASPPDFAFAMAVHTPGVHIAPPFPITHAYVAVEMVLMGDISGGVLYCRRSLYRYFNQSTMATLVRIREKKQFDCEEFPFIQRLIRQTREEMGPPYSTVNNIWDSLNNSNASRTVGAMLPPTAPTIATMASNAVNLAAPFVQRAQRTLSSFVHLHFLKSKRLSTQSNTSIGGVRDEDMSFDLPANPPVVVIIFFLLTSLIGMVLGMRHDNKWNIWKTSAAERLEHFTRQRGLATFNMMSTILAVGLKGLQACSACVWCGGGGCDEIDGSGRNSVCAVANARVETRRRFDRVWKITLENGTRCSTLFSHVVCAVLMHANEWEHGIEYAERSIVHAFDGDEEAGMLSEIYRYLSIFYMQKHYQHQHNSKAEHSNGILSPSARSNSTPIPQPPTPAASTQSTQITSPISSSQLFVNPALALEPTALFSPSTSTNPPATVANLHSTSASASASAAAGSAPTSASSVAVCDCHAKAWIAACRSASVAKHQDSPLLHALGLTQLLRVILWLRRSPLADVSANGHWTLNLPSSHGVEDKHVTSDEWHCYGDISALRLVYASLINSFHVDGAIANICGFITHSRRLVEEEFANLPQAIVGQTTSPANANTNSTTPIGSMFAALCAPGKDKDESCSVMNLFRSASPMAMAAVGVAAAVAGGSSVSDAINAAKVR